MNRKRRRKPHQLSLAALNVNDDLRKFLGQDGWTLMFKPAKDAQVLGVSGRIDEVYDALEQWTKEFPHYYSAIIYRPSGAKHRTIKNEGQKS
jgi:hypothetical protein